MTALTAFGRENLAARFDLFSFHIVTKKLKTKILIKNDIVILKTVLKERT